MRANPISALAVAAFLLGAGIAPSRAAEGEISLLPAGVIRKGSLANQQLIFDASVAATR